MQEEDSEHLMCKFGIEMINPTEKHARAIVRYVLIVYLIGQLVCGGRPSPSEVIPSGPRIVLGLADEIISVQSWQRSWHSEIWG